MSSRARVDVFFRRVAKDAHARRRAETRTNGAMKNTDPKTRAAASTPEVKSLDTGEQLSLELESESQHQTGKRKEKMIDEANAASGKPQQEKSDRE